MCSRVFLSSQTALVRLNRALKNVEGRRKPSIWTGPCWSSAWGLAFCSRGLGGVLGPWAVAAVGRPLSLVGRRRSCRGPPRAVVVALPRGRRCCGCGSSPRCRSPLSSVVRLAVAVSPPCRCRCRRPSGAAASLRRLLAVSSFYPCAVALEDGTVNSRKTYGQARCDAVSPIGRQG